MEKCEFKPFGEKEWQLYSGAEGEPLVCYTEGMLNGVVHDLIIVLDDNGINLDYCLKPDDKKGMPYGEWAHDLYFETDGGIGVSTAAFNMLDLSNATLIGLKALGFTYNDLQGGE
jgi:hypothetical protein